MKPLRSTRRWLISLGLAALATWHAHRWFGLGGLDLGGVGLGGVALGSAAVWWTTLWGLAKLNPPRAIRVAAVLGGLAWVTAVDLFMPPVWIPTARLSVKTTTPLPEAALRITWGEQLGLTRTFTDNQALVPADALGRGVTLYLAPAAFDFGQGRFPTLSRLVIEHPDGTWVAESDALALHLRADEGKLTPNSDGVELRPTVSDRPFLVALQLPAALTSADHSWRGTMRLGHLALYAFLCGALLSGALARCVSPRLLPRLELLFVTTALMLLGTELALRALRPAPTGFHVWEPGFKARFNPMPGVMPGISGEAQLSINKDGVRAREIEPTDRFRILAIGGSTTECLYLDQAETWTGVLESELKARGTVPTWVGNVGHSGHTTREHILQVRHLLTQPPKVDAIVLLVGINDLSLRLQQGDAGYRPDYMDTPAGAQALMNRAFRVYPQEAAAPRGVDDLALTRLWRAATAPAPATPGDRPVMVQDECGKFLIDVRLRRQREPRLDRLPDLSTAIDEYRRNLDQIADIVQRHRVRLIVMTQPAIWNPAITAAEKKLLVFGRGVGGYYRIEHLRAGLERYNTALREFAARRGIECVDLAAVLPKDTTVFSDDVHFNESGARQVAAALAGHLLERPPFD